MFHSKENASLSVGLADFFSLKSNSNAFVWSTYNRTQRLVVQTIMDIGVNSFAHKSINRTGRSKRIAILFLYSLWKRIELLLDKFCEQASLIVSLSKLPVRIFFFFFLSSFFLIISEMFKSYTCRLGEILQSIQTPMYLPQSDYIADGITLEQVPRFV
uniref:Uncharacterized protein n=1 Tax=Pararge aegeria TaxID=116150 RepID=S4PXX5_9NEOP